MSESCNFTHPKQEAEEEKEISNPGVDEGERLRSVQVQFSVHYLSFTSKIGPWICVALYILVRHEGEPYSGCECVRLKKKRGGGARGSDAVPPCW